MKEKGIFFTAQFQSVMMPRNWTLKSLLQGCFALVRCMQASLNFCFDISKTFHSFWHADDKHSTDETSFLGNAMYMFTVKLRIGACGVHACNPCTARKKIDF